MCQAISCAVAKNSRIEVRDRSPATSKKLQSTLNHLLLVARVQKTIEAIIGELWLPTCTMML